MNWVVDVEALWQSVSPTEQEKEQAQAEYESSSTLVLRRPPSKIELRKVPATSVRVDGLEEQILFSQGPTSTSVVGRPDDVAVRPVDVTGSIDPAVFGVGATGDDAERRCLPRLGRRDHVIRRGSIRVGAKFLWITTIL